LIQRLEGHPWFRLTALAASGSSAGRPYEEAVVWRLSTDPPQAARRMVVRRCDRDELGDCDLVLSGLDASVAQEVEPSFAAAGFAVISNSSAFRQAADVPLLIPEVNPDQIALIDRQRSRFAAGFIVTNPNCVAIGLALALAPIQRSFGIRRVVVSTMQAVSGAGSAGPRALDLLGNVVPFIGGEEQKLEAELRKILGSVHDAQVSEAEIELSAHCHRVPTIDGHLAALSLETVHPASIEQFVETLEGFRGEIAGEGLPGAPESPIVVRREDDRPQPRLDRNTAGGMAVVVGRIRPCPVLGVKCVILSHNTVRGAAGGTLLNAELLAARNRLPRRTRA